MVEPTSIGVKIPTKNLPWIIAAFVGVSGGGVGAEFYDVLGARKWKDSHIEQLQEAEESARRIIALEAQNAQLLEMITVKVCGE